MMEILGYTIRAMAATMLEDEWRSAIMECGEGFVTRCGISTLPPWLAGALDMETTVSPLTLSRDCHS